MGKKYKVYIEIGMEVVIYEHCIDVLYVPTTSTWTFKNEGGKEVYTTLNILVEEEEYGC